MLANPKYNRNAIAELLRRGYHSRHIAIVFECNEKSLQLVCKTMEEVEPTLRFLSIEQKKRLYVLDKCLRLKPLGHKWSSNEYYYITLLRFLLVPKETIKTIYKTAPQRQVAIACRELAPKLKELDYRLLGVTSEEYELFVRACYNLTGDPTKWK